MSPPTLKERVLMALAEAGYPNARSRGSDDWPEVRTDKSQSDDPPIQVLWRAFVVSGYPSPCWSCYDNGCCALGRDADPHDYCEDVGALDCGHDHALFRWVDA